MSENEKVRKISPELGTTGLKHSAGIVLEEDTPKLKDFNLRMKYYKEMRESDPVVGAILFALVMQARRAIWTVDSYSENPKDKQAAEFIEKNISNLKHSWEDFLIEALEFIPYGFSLFEIIYELVEGKVLWKKFAPRAQCTVDRWEFEDNGDLAGFWQVDFYSKNPANEVFIPLDKLLLFRSTSIKGNPEGSAALRNAFRSYYIKKKLEIVEAIGLERDLAGYPVLSVPEDMFDETEESKKLLSYAENLITRIRKDEQMGVIKSTEWELELLSASGSKGSEMNVVIERYDTRIAQSLLADIILLGHRAMGSYALAEMKSQMFTQALSSFLDSIKDTINNHAIPKILQLNGYHDLEEYPKLSHGPVQQIDFLRLANVLFRYVDKDIVVPDDDLEKFLRHELGLPKANKDTARKEEVLPQDSRIGDRKDNETRTASTSGDYNQDLK